MSYYITHYLYQFTSNSYTLDDLNVVTWGSSSIMKVLPYPSNLWLQIIYVCIHACILKCMLVVPFSGWSYVQFDNKCDRNLDDKQLWGWDSKILGLVPNTWSYLKCGSTSVMTIPKTNKRKRRIWSVVGWTEEWYLRLLPD